VTTDPQRYSFSVNAQPVEVMASPKAWLMNVIRGLLRLIGTGVQQE
jgi:aerobic-type carbon monoxide dehydrogenase small subunit (CoxS/CutS family)